MSLQDLIDAGPHGFAKEQNLVMNQRLLAETERWIRKALEAVPGWNVWRSNMEVRPENAFVMVWQFQLIPHGARPPGTGTMFHQPDLSEGERARLIAGRHDWQDARWEDECGVPGCGHKCCEDYRYGRT